MTVAPDTTEATASPNWYALGADEAVARLRTDLAQGLSGSEAASRLATYGPNSLPKEVPPSVWQVALEQLRDPMNVMLVAVTVLSLVIGQVSTAILVGVLVGLNVVISSKQELNARASVEALDELQAPSARAVRDAAAANVPAVDLVPGDVVMVEAGDLVPADGRIVVSASLEVQEAALTGESAPVAKDATTIERPDVALGDRTNLVFQNTSVTRGTATFVVTSTGSSTEMGKIAGLLSEVERSKSPLQRELADLTKWIGIVAWVAVAIIFFAGLARGVDGDTLILLCVLTAISAIPAGLPTFVQIMLSSGAQRLAEAKAIVKNLTDVETLGATSAINSDKTGTLTLNEMTAKRLFVGGRWYSIEGGGYSKQGAILHGAGDDTPDFTPLAYGLTLCSDATVSDDGEVVGDPTEAALVVLAAKMGVDAATSRRELPRLAEVPFDSAYKFMATFHRVEDFGDRPLVELVKGAPDVVLDRCSKVLWQGQAVPAEQVRDEIVAANQELSEHGLRVLSFAIRAYPDSALEEIRSDPMAQVEGLTFVALVGIIDPLRPTAKEAVRVALDAGIDVRMITGDHAVTAKAIADELGLGPGVISGVEFQRLSDEELDERLPELHVFGRVAPEDKLRLATRMQEAGMVVAMTGDAVNDAAALKKADIGVAMGSGSEVSKQAAKMILTDDRFATLVHAVELGRDIYAKVTAYIGYQITGMIGLLALMLAATVFDVNQGVAQTPGMILYVSLVIAGFPVFAILTDEPEPGVMRRPPRDPAVPVFNRSSGLRWVLIGTLMGIVAVLPLAFGPGEPSVDEPSVAMTMTFGVVAFSTVLIGVVARHDRAPFWQGPPTPYFTWLGAAGVLSWLAIELPVLQRWVDTVSLTGSQWLVVLGLSLVAPVVFEVEKAFRRHRLTS